MLLKRKIKEKAPSGRDPFVIAPHTYLVPYKIQGIGCGWGPCPVRFFLDGDTLIEPSLILLGSRSGTGVVPVQGEFVVLFNLPQLEPALHRIVAVADERGERIEHAAEFGLENVPETEPDGRPTMRWMRRRLHFMRERFPDGVNRMPGSRLRALAHRDVMRALKHARATGDPNTGGPPVVGGANWYCIGPSVVRRGQVFDAVGNYTLAPISGRITSIAYDPLDTNVVYAAAAQGGVWKTTDGGLNWRPMSDYAPSLAIGCVTVDSSATLAGRSARILAGTGEPNNSDSYYGSGMLFSSDAGGTWSARGTATFVRAAFSAIAVDPANNQHLYAATDIGVYESIDEGVNWNVVEPGICHDLVVDWTNVGGAELYVGRQGLGVRRSTNGGAVWSTLGGGLPAAPGRVALAKAPSNVNVLYAVFAGATGNISGIFRTGDGGTNWNPVSVPAGTGQAGYNLVIAVSPGDPDTLLLGEVHLWRSTTGGGSWTRVSTGSPGIHADQHAIAFHPTNNSLVYVGNDGGVFYSNNGGVTFTHRNKDLATLQYFTCANHGQWEAVMFGGTQDNGAQRYLGHPAWEHSALGDGAYAGINSTGMPLRWFESRWWGFPLFRSDSAGNPGTWVDKKGTITTNSAWFYPPFELDPSNSDIVYVGYNQLWRSPDAGDSWMAIGGVLMAGNNITAIAVAPSNGNIVYVGLQNGPVFRLQFAASVWTATNVTSAPLPAGQISDIAVHPSDPNTVFVTTSNLIFSEGAGEFTNDHVFRTTNGGTNWTNISSGLAQTNPVNAIAIDTMTPTRIFIGCDVGIFRSEDSGDSWTPWDEGLPNCSVQDLKFFAPQRLLRAATHGRSIWERPVDAATVPATDVYLRDDLLDTGRTTPPPSGVEHPFNPGEWLYWWQSADVKIDSPDPVTNTYQTPSRDIDYVQFEEAVHDNPRRDTFVRVWVQVHNRGYAPATNVQVRAFWASAAAGLPPLPADFWTAFPLSDPSGTGWTPIGPTRAIAILYPGYPQIVSWSWFVPASAPTHSCILAVVQSNEDSIATSSLDVATAVTTSNNVTLKNLHVDVFVPGGAGADEGIGPFYLDFATSAQRVPFDIRINTASLPKTSRLLLVLADHELEQPPYAVSVERTKLDRIPERPDEMCGDREPTRYRLDRGYVVDVPNAEDRDRPAIRGIVPWGERLSSAIYVRVPQDVKPGETFTFAIEQWVEGRLVGGSTFELRAEAPKPEEKIKLTKTLKLNKKKDS